MICKVCESEFDEKDNPEKCPFCYEKYFVISLTDYQKLVERIQDKQYEADQLFNQVWEASNSSNKFKNYLNRECDIYRSIKVWFDMLMEEFNIPKTEGEYRSKPYYKVPKSCQLNPNKVCNGCGDC